jgi:hypothetical protein
MTAWREKDNDALDRLSGYYVSPGFVAIARVQFKGGFTDARVTDPARPATPRARAVD